MSSRTLAPLVLVAVLALGLFVQQQPAEAQADGYSLTCRPISLRATAAGLSMRCAEGTTDSEVVIPPGSPLFQATPALVTMAHTAGKLLTIHVRPTPAHGPVADSVEVHFEQLVHESPYIER